MFYMRVNETTAHCINIALFLNECVAPTLGGYSPAHSTHQPGGEE